MPSPRHDDLDFSFPPLIAGAPHTLILGTMPGQKSLQAARYYAHPQNQFWRLVGEIYGFKAALPYEERIEALTAHGVAVWDVVQCCLRAGSMDADIREETVNDFAALFAQYPTIRRVVFDSLTAEKLYARHVLPHLEHAAEYHRVPSPSPAYAKMRYADKLAAWKKVLTAPR